MVRISLLRLRRWLWDRIRWPIADPACVLPVKRTPLMDGPKITRARLVMSPFTSEQMAVIGTALADSVRKRIHSGINAAGSPSKALSPRYAKTKQKKGLQNLRDWFYTGKTLASLQLLSTNENAGKVGFSNTKADRIAHVLNATDKAFGIATTDRAAMNDALSRILHGGNIVKFLTAAA
jgi:hypothetical protein